MSERIRELVSRGYSAPDDVIMDEYFEWLTYVSNIGKDYSMLAEILHERTFYSIVHNDENRGEDGKVLRKIFEQETLFDDYSCLADRGCSMLEMLIGLAIRMETILEDPYEGDRTVRWFWEILDNLGLSKYTNYELKYHNKLTEVQEIIDNLLERRYSRSGKGGLFPLKNAKKDQRKVEIWYQLSAYLLENYINEEEIVG